MQMEKTKKNKKMRPWTVFWYSVAWTVICLSLIVIGAFAAKFIFG